MNPDNRKHPSIQSVGAVNVLKTSSSLIGESLNHCRQALHDSLANRCALIVLDLRDSPLINSEGLEFIVEAQRQCLARGGRLVLAEPQPLLAEILFITGVEQSVAVFTNLRAALGDFAK